MGHFQYVCLPEGILNKVSTLKLPSESIESGPNGDLRTRKLRQSAGNTWLTQRPVPLGRTWEMLGKVPEVKLHLLVAEWQSGRVDQRLPKQSSRSDRSHPPGPPKNIDPWSNKNSVGTCSKDRGPGSYHWWVYRSVWSVFRHAQR